MFWAFLSILTWILVELILILLHKVIIVALLSHYKKNYNFQKSKQ